MKDIALKCFNNEQCIPIFLSYKFILVYKHLMFVYCLAIAIYYGQCCTEGNIFIHSLSLLLTTMEF